MVQRSTAGKVWSRFVDARGRSSQTTVEAPLLHCMHRTVRGKPYLSSVDPRRRTVRLRDFAARSSAAAYSHTPTPLDRGLVWRPRAGSLVSICRHSQEEFTNNRFALLFIDIDYVLIHVLIYCVYAVSYIEHKASEPGASIVSH